MIGAARTEAAEICGPGGPRKLSDDFVVGEVRDDAASGRQLAAQRRQNLRRYLSAVRHGLVSHAAEDHRLARPVRVDELSHLVDGPDAVQVALALRVAPGEQAVAAENQPVASRVVPDAFFNHQRELEAGPLPWNPDNPPVEAGVELVQLPLAVRAGGQRNCPVRMQVIDMRGRE